MTTTLQKKSWLSEIDWVTSLFLILTPILSVVFSIRYFQLYDLNWPVMIFAAVFLAVAQICITAGYHRLFAHCAYKASVPARLFFLLFGAANFQGSALKWSSDHRRHHARVDTDDDPYSINKGFWYAHIGWLFTNDPHVHRPINAADLQNDKYVAWQHKYFVTLAIAMGFGLPCVVGWFMGDAIGGLVFGGFVRIVLGHHFTFFINSLCHMVGTRPYSEKITARDSFVMAILTWGEGYHNYHHRFETDYRNGIKWYHWDPTKWTIRTMAFLGMAYKLNRVSPTIVMRARLQMDEQRYLARGIPSERLQELRARVEETQRRFRELMDEYQKFKISVKELSRETVQAMADDVERKKAELRAQVRMAKRDFKYALANWRYQHRLVPANA